MRSSEFGIAGKPAVEIYTPVRPVKITVNPVAVDGITLIEEMSRSDKGVMAKP